MRQFLHKTFKFYIAVLLCAVMVLSFSLLNVNAESAYESFTYDSSKSSIEAPDAYEVEKVIYGETLGIENFSEPSDIAIDESGMIYLLDSGNGRIIVLDSSMNLVSVIDRFTIGNEETSLNKPKGLEIKGDTLYIADTENRRVVCSDTKGNIFKVLTKPDSDVFSKTVEFIPQKLVIDNAGNLYVQSLGVYQGLTVYDNEFNFKGFFGSENVTTTADLLKEYIWKQFMSKEQKEAMANYVPNEIRSMAVDKEGFIYTLTNASYMPLSNEKMSMDSIRRLNPKGENTLVNKMPGKAFSALEADARYMNFTDICVDEKNYHTVVDNSHGVIMQFDKNCNLVTAFGCIGNYQGAFVLPSAIETYNDKLYIVDSTKCSVTVLKLTKFGSLVRTALDLYNEGMFAEAVEPWKQVLSIDANFELAHVGIGNAYYNQRMYKEAIKEFSLGNDSERYNEAYKEYRVIFLRENFVFILVGIVAVWIVYKCIVNRKIITKKLATIKKWRED